MITVLFASLLLLSMAVALLDWRRAWLMAIACGVLQDAARKLTPGTPVIMSLSIVPVYAMVLLAAHRELQSHGSEFTKRFRSVYICFLALLLFLALAAGNGIATFGTANWKGPALSLFLYCMPFPAILLGYTWLQREEQLEVLFRFYAVLTSFALIGTTLEYFNVPFPALGTVGLQSNLRFFPGMEVRMLSGFYRGPDIMGWHAATLSCIGVIMALHRRKLFRSGPWILAAGWGFVNCLMSGRRKAVYMVAAFFVVLLWRYMRRLRFHEAITIVLLLATMFVVVHQISQNEDASVYAKGALTTVDELFQRLEGGVRETVGQFGFMGAGLGTATQGTQHLGGNTVIGWQEGGLGKLAIELGVPGLLSLVVLVFVMMRFLLKLTRHPDIPESSQLFRAGLFAVFIGDVVTFMVSAQAYSDPLLTLLTAFMLGCLFATSQLDERVPAIAEVSTTSPVRSSPPGVIAAT
jgi:Ca2+/Na+ antiporter